MELSISIPTVWRDIKILGELEIKVNTRGKWTVSYTVAWYSKWYGYVIQLVIRLPDTLNDTIWSSYQYGIIYNCLHTSFRQSKGYLGIHSPPYGGGAGGRGFSLSFVPSVPYVIMSSIPLSLYYFVFSVFICHSVWKWLSLQWVYITWFCTKWGEGYNPYLRIKRVYNK